jgi:hypothetical protein
MQINLREDCKISSAHPNLSLCRLRVGTGFGARIQDMLRVKYRGKSRSLGTNGLATRLVLLVLLLILAATRQLGVSLLFEASSPGL